MASCCCVAFDLDAAVRTTATGVISPQRRDAIVSLRSSASTTITFSGAMPSLDLRGFPVRTIFSFRPRWRSGRPGRRPLRGSRSSAPPSFTLEPLDVSTCPAIADQPEGRLRPGPAPGIGHERHGDAESALRARSSLHPLLAPPSGPSSRVAPRTSGAPRSVSSPVAQADQAQVLPGVEVLGERRLLGRDPNHPFHGQRILPYVVTHDPRLAAGQRQAPQHLDGGGLACPIGAEQRKQLTGVNRKINAVDCFEFSE